MKSNIVNGRYCQFSGFDCPSKINKTSDLKIFCAYPSVPRIKGYMSQLAESNQLTGIDVYLWERLGGSAGVIFCKICNEIINSTAFLADITILNQNVLFELGFAIAKEKVPFLIKEQGRESQKLELLSDITHIPYSDISALAGKIAYAIYDEFPKLLHVQETSEQQGLLFINADANLPIKRIIFNHLQEICSSISLKIDIDDSSELFSHKLMTLLNKVERNHLVVCHMVGTDFRGFDQINAHVSFLAGFALGRNKKMLILQESPCDRMIDLQQVRKEYSDVKGALSIINDWLQPIIDEEKKLISQKRKVQEIITLQDQLFSALGHPAAEYDTYLSQYFIQSPAYLDAIKCRRTLLLGRRGAGKTANFLQLQDAFRRQVNNIVINVSPSKLQLLNTVEKMSEILGSTKITAIFEVFWEYLLITEIAIYCKEYSSEFPYQSEPELFNELNMALKSDEMSLLPFDYRFNKLIDSMIKENDNDDKNILKANILEKFYKDILPLAKRIISNISKHHPIRILIDNLDRDWNNAGINSISYLINALLDVMDKINVRNLLGDAIVITFLREDIYKISSKYDPDYDKRQACTLQWDKDTLKTLVCERIGLVQRTSVHNINKLWENVFGSKVGEIDDTFEYIVERTMLRPRDIITFCAQILNEMTRRKMACVTEEIIKKAEREYSEYLLKNLRQEFSVGYPDVEDVCIALFVGKPHNFIEQHLKKRISDEPSVCKGLGIMDIIKFLFDIGVIGIEIDRKNYFSFAGFDYIRTRKNAESKGPVKYLIHSGLLSALSVSVSKHNT
ncbi:MAG: hypothetical protein ABFD91_15055 [Anaerohalosphaeraceae bacterium]